jgi:hypothetical protein
MGLKEGIGPHVHLLVVLLDTMNFLEEEDVVLEE